MDNVQFMVHFIYTNEGKFTGALELCPVPHEYWVDCMVDLGIEYENS